MIQRRARPRDCSATVENAASGYLNRVEATLSSQISPKTDLVTIDLLPSPIMDSVSLPRLVGVLFVVIIVHRLHIRYQEYQVIYF